MIILISESSVGLYLLSVVSLACPSQWTFFQQKDQGVFQGPTQISASPAAGFLFNSLALQLLSSTEFLEVLTWSQPMTCMEFPCRFWGIFSVILYSPKLHSQFLAVLFAPNPDCCLLSPVRLLLEN